MRVRVILDLETSFLLCVFRLVFGALMMSFQMVMKCLRPKRQACQAEPHENQQPDLRPTQIFIPIVVLYVRLEGSN